MLRAKNIGVQVEIIHNASAMGAAAASGLQVYFCAEELCHLLDHIRSLCLAVVSIWIHGFHTTF